MFVTNDNPLWSTSNEVEDDPFKPDFSDSSASGDVFDGGIDEE